MKNILKIGLFALSGLPIISSVSFISKDNDNSNSQDDANIDKKDKKDKKVNINTFAKDKKLREKLSGKGDKWNNLTIEYNQGDLNYTESIFENTFNYFLPKDPTFPAFDNDVIMDQFGQEIPLDTNTIYSVQDLYDNAANFANAVIENDDNVLGWMSPYSSQNIKVALANSQPLNFISSHNVSNAFRALDKLNNSRNYEKNNALVFLPGGPNGDIDENALKDFIHLGFGNFASGFVLNQAQYGFVPNEVVYKNKDKYLNSQIKNQKNFKYIEKQILNENLTQIEALLVLTQDLQLSVYETLIATSMAFSKIDADKTALLGEILKNTRPGYNYNLDFDKVYLAGGSHGFTSGVDAILFNKFNVDIYNDFILFNNHLSPAQDNSENTSGGVITKEDEDTFVGNRQTMDIFLDLARNTFKYIWGQLDYFNYKLQNYKLGDRIKNQFHALVTVNDLNVGNPSDQELQFYRDNQLDFTYDQTSPYGHNNSFSIAKLDEIFDK